MEISRRHYLFDGRVQGVGFRFTAKMIADRLGLTGWIINCANSQVEMEIQGNQESIDSMIAQILSSKSLRITDMQMQIVDSRKEDKFCIRY